MRNVIRTVCLLLALVPLLACGKKRVIDPAPPPAAPSEPSPAPEPAAPQPTTPDPGPPSLPKPDPVVQHNWADDGDEAYLGESWDKAIEFYEIYLEEDPVGSRRDHVHFRLGLLTAWKGDYAKAIQQLQAVRSEAVEPETRVQVALLLALLDQASKDAQEKRNLKQTLNEIMKKLDS